MKKILVLITFFSLMSFSAEINASLGLNTSVPLLGGLGSDGPENNAAGALNAGGGANIGVGLQGRIGLMFNPKTEISLNVGYDNFIWTADPGDNSDYSLTNMPIFVHGRFYSNEQKVDYFEVGVGYGVTNINLDINDLNVADESLGSIGLLIAYGTSFDLGLGQPIDTSFYYRFQFSNGVEMDFANGTKLNYYVAYLGVQLNYEFNIIK